MSLAFAQEKYATPEAAADALIASARSGDEKAGLVVLGPSGGDIISSGDKVSDDAVRARFVNSYDAKHEIKMQGDNKATLIIGDNNYPFPIPLVRSAGKWSFDTQAGRLEILARRIGHNELDTIQTALAYVDAQDEYASKDRTGGGVGVYAQRLISEPGKKDGLYWPTDAKARKKSPRRALRAGVARRLRRRQSRALPWLLLQDPDQARAARDRRRGRLRRQRQDDRRIRARRLSR